VIVPMFNSERWLVETVESVLRQRGVDWNLVLIDDGGTDGSYAIADRLARRDPRITAVRQQNAGVCAARNAGASIGNSEFLLFLDADDVLLPDALCALTAGFTDSAVSAVHGEVLTIDENGRSVPAPPWSPRMRLSRWWLKPMSPDDESTPPEAFLIGTGALPAATMIRRGAFHAVDGWDERLGQYHEDADLWGRLAIEGNVRYLAKATACYRMHAGQASGDAALEARQRQSLLAKWRDGDAAARRVARIYDHRATPLHGLRAARRLAGQGDVLSAARFAMGALRAYRLNV
jgi:glycosyltransferase involved in cell wall biosynthesis